jgi:putative transposase
MAAQEKKMAGIAPEVLDQLLAGRDPKSVLSDQGLIGDLRKAIAERLLNAEMDQHLDCPEQREAGNHRNGRSPKRVLTDSGAMELSIPRDRHGQFDPLFIRKYQRRFPGFDTKVIALYARGMSTRDIQAHIRELYGFEISAQLVSAVTEAVLEEVRLWQNRPLEPTYAIVFFDALRVKIRDEGMVHNQAVYLAIGIRTCGRKEVLGIWVERSEGAKFWLRVMSELKARGTQDILIAVVDGLKGFADAICSVFPSTVVQTCIVHLIRHSLSCASWRDRKSLASALKPLYRAAHAEAAEQELKRFEASAFGQRYPMIAQSWRRHWSEVIPFFAFDPALRKIIYTTNAIESLHSQVRRSIRNKGHFPNEEAALKLIWLSLQQITAKWKNPPMEWSGAKLQFAIHFPDRFKIEE